MTEPFAFASTTRRFGLPLLVPGQAQKEISVNAASTLVDALLHPAVRGETATPPADSAEGDCWIVGSAPTDVFAGKEGKIAIRTDGDWTFVTAIDGLRVLDLSRGQFILFRDGWHTPREAVAPSGGSVVDVEARHAIAEVIGVLRDAAIL